MYKRGSVTALLYSLKTSFFVMKLVPDENDNAPKRMHGRIFLITTTILSNIQHEQQVI